MTLPIDLSELSGEELDTLSNHISKEVLNREAQGTVPIYVVYNRGYEILYSTNNIAKLTEYLTLNLSRLVWLPPDTTTTPSIIISISRLKFEEWRENSLFKPDATHLPY